MKKSFLYLITIGLICFSCTGKSLIEDKTTLAKIKERTAARQAWLPKLPTDISNDERQALQFLYSYMPVGDVGDYSVEFFLANVRSSLATREQLPWGDSINEREFLHFVLPVRVNNEALDSSRIVFFDELKDRVKGLSMKQAILEVNHWCHEKVNYSPSDARTMSPLALLCNATGRCGEESTFVVAALRAVGIPARQIYVPRWAHTDDNHAWVEAWAAEAEGSGKWYYMGACEPEAELNIGWFDAPAKRSLMMLTKVFGQYNGPEQVLAQEDGYTEISVTENYAPVNTATVVVRDENGHLAPGAKVLYTIYNYASFYPAVSQVSDSKGESSLTAGRGDMVVFASRDGQVASGILNFRKSDTLFLKLGPLPTTYREYDITPPDELPVESKISAQAQAENRRRFVAEDSMRSAYVATFITRQTANTLSREIGVDEQRVWDIISQSRGNSSQISMFLLNAPRKNVNAALDLLEVISPKDLRDTPCDILLSHLNAALPFVGRKMFKEYILNPRIDNEMLRSYRTVLSVNDTTVKAQKIIDSYKSIAIVDSLNPARLAISPLGVARMKMGDGASKERLVIAALRSNGIAARREPLSQRVQYYENDKWNYLTNDAANLEQAAKGEMKIVNWHDNTITNDPKLDTHFSMSKWDGSCYVPIQFESLGVDMGGQATLRDIFVPCRGTKMEQGQYMLTTGTRLSSGKVLVRNEPITVKKDSMSKLYLVMREATNELNVIGSISVEEKYTPRGANQAISLLTTTGRGYFILAMIEAKKEPTTHFMRALASQKKALQEWGRPIVLILPDKAQLKSLDLSDFPALPSTVKFGYDQDGAVSRMIGTGVDVKDMARMPVVVLGDSFGRVVYVSTGYNTSIGEQLGVIIKML
ncbi:MAG: transglutaminase-like domain-containing protein [Mucinivorans sp.]